MKISTLFSATAFCVGLFAATSVIARDYEDFDNIGPGFGSLTGTGDTGGPIEASQLDSQCVGYIDKTPDHTLKVTSDVRLTLTVSSDVDSVLVVTDGYSTFCDDDSAGNDDAQLSMTFPSGTYEVYVGSFDEDEYGRYTLHINEGEDASITPAPRARRSQPSQTPPVTNQTRYPHSTQGRYGNFTVGAGFTPDPQTATGISGYSDAGRIDAATFGKQCTGFIDTTPDHTITVTSSVNLRLTVSSEIDSVLVIRGPAGTFCDDDSGGNRDAQVNALFTPGEYEVYVGNIGEAGEYILTVTESSQGGYVT